MINDVNFLAYFRETYPNFNNISDADVTKTFNEVMCMYKEVNGISDECTQTVVAGYVVCHYLSLNGRGGNIAGGSGNMLSSASVGGISVSTQTPPVRDMYEYFFGSTTCGLKFLAYLASVGGIYYVN